MDPCVYDVAVGHPYEGVRAARIDGGAGIDARLHMVLTGDADTAPCPARMTPAIWDGDGKPDGSC